VKYGVVELRLLSERFLMAVSDVKHEFREWTDKMTLYQFFNNRVLKFCILCTEVHS